LDVSTTRCLGSSLARLAAGGGGKQLMTSAASGGGGGLELAVRARGGLA